MREELKKYGDEAYGLVESIANDIGPRIPGSENERKLHSLMSDKLKGIGLNPKTESFIFAPYGSIGGLPMAGWAGIIGMIALVIGMIIGQFTPEGGFAVIFAALIYMVCLWIWLVCSVFKYKTWFDWAFKHAKSQNTYAELKPEDGEYDYTIYLSGHTDTSWCLKLSASQYKMGFVGTIIKLATGAICVGLITVLVFVGFILACGNVDNGVDFAEPNSKYLIACGVLAPILIIGAFFLTMYNERSEAMASPGAMDNATGIAIAYETIKYFKENPDKMPARCRIIDANIGAEESGLRGSIAFTRRHKNDGMLDHAYHINIDSVADKDYFEVIHGDSWLCPHFDKGLRKDFMNAMKEAGIEKPGDIANPVGGCDSTPFQKSGVKSITFAAQNPIMSNYYHTYMDVPERFDADTVGLGLDVVLRVIDKIAAKEEKKAAKLAAAAGETKEEVKEDTEAKDENTDAKTEDDMDALFEKEASGAVISNEENVATENTEVEEKAEEVEDGVEENVEEVADEKTEETETAETDKVEEPAEAEAATESVENQPEEKVDAPADEPAKEESVEEPKQEEKTEETTENADEAKEDVPTEEPKKEEVEEKAEEPAKAETPAEENAKEESKQEEKAEEPKQEEKAEEPAKEEGPKQLKATCPNCKTKIVFTDADKTMTCPGCGKTYRNNMYTGYKF